jgi:hypothetical protein
MSYLKIKIRFKNYQNIAYSNQFPPLMNGLIWLFFHNENKLKQ